MLVLFRAVFLREQVGGEPKMAFEYDKTSSFIVSNDHHFRKDDPLFHCTCCLSEKFIALAKDSDARSYGFDGFRRRNACRSTVRSNRNSQRIDVRILRFKNPPPFLLDCGLQKPRLRYSPGLAPTTGLN